MNKKRLFFWIKILVIFYCGVGIALYYLQDRILFHTEKLHPDYTYKFKIPFHELNIPFSKNDTLNLIKFLPDTNKEVKGVVLFFHGAQGNVATYAERAALFTNQQYEVWMPDYPGFGKSSGEFSENKINSQAFEIKKLALNRFPNNKIIIYGQSLGASVATNLASTESNVKLILENPFYDVPDLLHHYTYIYPWSSMSKYRFSVNDAMLYLNHSVQINIIIGNTKELHSKASANKLKSLLDSNDSFVRIDQETATDMCNEQEYKDVVEKLLRDN
jgi:pimeloyl-ACP methyl ester carboxylesterase